MKISHATIRGLIRSILTESNKKPRPPGYEEALGDPSRTNQGIADEFGLNPMTVLRDRKVAGVQVQRGGQNKVERPPGYEEALKDSTRSLRSIGDEFGLSHTAVANDRREISVSSLHANLLIPRKLRLQNEDYLEALRDESRPTTEIAEEFGHTYNIVYNDRIDVVGYAPGRTRQERLPGYEEALRDSTRSVRSIGDEFDINPSTVLRDRREIGAARPSVKLRRDGYEEALRDMSRPSHDIALEFGLSQVTVINDRREIGIIRPATKERTAAYEEAIRDPSRTNQSIADEFDFSLGTVIKDRKKIGVSSLHSDVLKQPKIRLQNEDYLEALRDESRPTTEIAEEFGHTYSLVYNDRIGVLGRYIGLQNAGFQRRERPPGYEEALRDSTRSVRSIGDEFGLSHTAVANDRRRAIALQLAGSFDI